MRWRRSVNRDSRASLCATAGSPNTLLRRGAAGPAQQGCKGRARERVLARALSDKSLARFDRIALVLSGGAALGAYQAGAYAALESRGVRPNWIAGTAIGAINAAIIAGNLPHERSLRLRQFWQELSRRISARASHRAGRSLSSLFGNCVGRLRLPVRETAPVPAGELRQLV